MNKQIKTYEGITELDEKLVELLKENSYTIEIINSKTYHHGDESECHYCIGTLAIEENELDCEDCLDNDEILALYLQQNGYGNVNKAVEEFAASVIDLIPNDKELQDKIKAKVEELYGEGK